MTSSQQRKSKEQRLTELGISEEQFELYKQIFCRNRLEWGYLKWYAKGWKRINYPWWDGLILQHLSGEQLISLFPAIRIDYFMIDIDNHDSDHSASVQFRVKATIDAIDADPLVYTSSSSGSLRICYFLDRPYRRDDVLVFGQKLLEDAGLICRAGYIEIMATKKADRLPFGEDSYLCDPITLEPLYEVNLSGMITKAWELKSSAELKLPSTATTVSSLHESNNEFNATVADLLENGLSANITTNNALLAINYDLMGRRGMSAHDANWFLISWVHEHHNGLSNRINAGNIGEVESQISRIVASFDHTEVKYSGLKAHEPKKLLRIADAEQISTIFNDYPLQLATFSILEYVKTRGFIVSTIDYSTDPSHCFNTHSELLSTTPRSSISNLDVVNFLQVWECEIPYKAFLKFAGFNKRYPNRTLKELIDVGLIRLHKWENRKLHKCRTYHISFTFDENSKEVISLNEALIALRSKEELKSVYGRYRANQLVER